MGRRNDGRDDDESYEMEISPKRKDTNQWGHWRGPDFEDTTINNRSSIKQFLDTFKREPNTIIIPESMAGPTGREFDPVGAAYATAHTPLARQLKGRHLQMIAFGGSIGTLCRC